MNYFITGIGTNVGKTIVSAVIVEALQADYWKPIQSGINEGKDSDIIQSLISNSKTVIHPETYLLKEPLSPHFAAKLDAIRIDLDFIKLPVTENHLIIEGAGGILVPINQSEYVIDIAKKLDCELILVISNYLGCINHSLLSIDYLVKNNYRIKALVFNGKFDQEVKQCIIDYAPYLNIINIPTLKSLSKVDIADFASQIRLQQM
jgi:dethiobiotin synthetase